MRDHSTRIDAATRFEDLDRRCETALCVGAAARAPGFVEALASRFAAVVVARNVDEAVECLGSETLVSFALVDADSITGTVWLLLLAAQKRRQALRGPLRIFALQAAEIATNDAFTFAEWGVSALLRADVDAAHFLERLDATAVASCEPLAALARELVGRVGLFEMERAVRKAAVETALARTHGNQTQAAKLLNVERNLLLRELKDMQTTKRRRWSHRFARDARELDESAPPEGRHAED